MLFTFYKGKVKCIPHNSSAHTLWYRCLSAGLQYKNLRWKVFFSNKIFNTFLECEKEYHQLNIKI